MDWVSELYYVLGDAWRAAREAADLRRRLQAWWWVMTHRAELDTPGGGL